MATYTPNYGLHQWESSDYFRRTDFNEDFSQIDTALAAQNDLSGARAAALGHDLYNLLLRDRYDGKTTGWTRALVFDGFQDKSLVAEASDSLVFLDKAVGLSRGEQTLLGSGYTSVIIQNTQWLSSITFTATDYGYIHQARIQTQQASTTTREVSIQYRVWVNQINRYEGRANVKFQSIAYENALPVDNVLVCPGDQVFFAVAIPDNTLLLHASPENDTFFGVYFDLTPVGGASGTITTPAQPIGVQSDLWAWVRHEGGSIGLSVSDSEGGMVPFSLRGSRVTQRPDGTLCTESEFRLTQPPQGESLIFQLQLELGGSDHMLLYDYGILVR